MTTPRTYNGELHLAQTPSNQELARQAVADHRARAGSPNLQFAEALRAIADLCEQQGPGPKDLPAIVICVFDRALFDQIVAAGNGELQSLENGLRFRQRFNYTAIDSLITTETEPAPVEAESEAVDVA